MHKLFILTKMSISALSGRIWLEGKCKQIIVTSSSSLWVSLCKLPMAAGKKPTTQLQQ